MRNFPKHDDIANDLNEKKERDPQEYAKLYLLLKKVFDCEDVTYEEMKSLSFSCGLPAEHILKVIKWLFIEQNIRYRNYSGRNKTWGLVPEVEELIRFCTRSTRTMRVVKPLPSSFYNEIRDPC